MTRGRINQTKTLGTEQLTTQTRAKAQHYGRHQVSETEINAKQSRTTEIKLNQAAGQKTFGYACYEYMSNSVSQPEIKSYDRLVHLYHSHKKNKQTTTFKVKCFFKDHRTEIKNLKR